MRATIRKIMNEAGLAEEPTKNISKKRRRDEDSDTEASDGVDEWSPWTHPIHLEKKQKVQDNSRSDDKVRKWMKVKEKQPLNQITVCGSLALEVTKKRKRYVQDNLLNSLGRVIKYINDGDGKGPPS